MEKDRRRKSWNEPISAFTLTRQNLPHMQVPGSYYFTASNTWNRRELSFDERDLVMETILIHRDMKYDLIAAVVMPDHFHLILCPLQKDERGVYSLQEIFHSIKSYTANKLRQRLWQDENYDHIIRNEKDYQEKYIYLINNPVEAGLVERPEDYRWLYCPAMNLFCTELDPRKNPRGGRPPRRPPREIPVTSSHIAPSSPLRQWCGPASRSVVWRDRHHL